MGRICCKCGRNTTDKTWWKTTIEVESGRSGPSGSWNFNAKNPLRIYSGRKYYKRVVAYKCDWCNKRGYRSGAQIEADRVAKVERENAKAYAIANGTYRWWRPVPDITTQIRIRHESHRAQPPPRPSVGSTDYLPQRRHVGVILGLAIFWMPFVFSWFLLRRGYSNISRVAGFSWLALLSAAMLAQILIHMHPENSRNVNVAQSTEIDASREVGANVSEQAPELPMTQHGSSGAIELKEDRPLGSKVPLMMPEFRTLHKHEFVCSTAKHLVVIDLLAEGDFRYRAWNVPRTVTESPDVSLGSGVYSLTGTRMCSHSEWSFRTGNVEYVVSDGVSCTDSDPPADATGRLAVFINGQLRSAYWCTNPRIGRQSD